ncbi:hypothetical protein SCP_0300470 [Sparassis crispa]|uniref:Uncharacterized protein n=1 Tax=Sparassis crispa TaxID=139825 RepID=A0A401GDS5_9APHY|nr:hypothetical protein SCP_0300470 [Sparassis crispa]GBE80332.1 hypothetical protein SCP_0300470 [Sparassis crispa]
MRSSIPSVLYHPPKAAQRRGEKMYIVFRGLALGPGVYETWDEVKAMCIGVSRSLYQQALIALLPPSAQLKQIPYDCTNIQLLSSVARTISGASVTLKSPIVASGGNSSSPASGLPSPTVPPLCTPSRSVLQSPGGRSAKPPTPLFECDMCKTHSGHFFSPYATIVSTPLSLKPLMQKAVGVELLREVIGRTMPVYEGEMLPPPILEPARTSQPVLPSLWTSPASVSFPPAT